MNPTTPVMEFQDAGIFFNGQAVLQNLSHVFTANAVTAIIGSSGTGKTTLLRTLSRMNDRVPGFRVQGGVRVGGHEIYGNGVDVYRLRRRVGMLFQKPCVFPKSIFDNVVFGLHHLQAGKSRDFPEIVERALREVFLWQEVKDRLHQSALTLSQGQQQRLVIARTLTVDPEILLMDEPTSALDPNSSEAIERLIAALKDRHTIVMVTHNLAQAKKVADEVMFLCDGEVCETGKSRDFFENPCRNETRDYLGK